MEVSVKEQKQFPAACINIKIKDIHAAGLPSCQEKQEHNTS